jgi:hypothetical protein
MFPILSPAQAGKCAIALIIGIHHCRADVATAASTNLRGLRAGNRRFSGQVVNLHKSRRGAAEG